MSGYHLLFTRKIVIDYDIPNWLADDTARRRRARKQARRGVAFIALLVKVVLLFAVSAAFGALLYGAYSLWQEIGKDTLVYIAPRIVEAAEVGEVKKVVSATVTAYTSSVDETDDTPFTTASGATTGHGVIACPPKYDFGTKVIIGETEYTCEDRMNPRYHDQERFDVWVETKEEAFEWGVRKVKVEVLAMI